MTRLQKWMTRQRETDESLADKLGRTGRRISRVQITRIRNGDSGASKQTALALQKVTGIPWHEFIGPAESRVGT